LFTDDARGIDGCEGVKVDDAVEYVTVVLARDPVNEGS
jgi:hypothetical protein